MNTNNIIYMIRNVSNNKIYIGQTTRGLQKRFKEHMLESNKRDTRLYSAIRKYGVESFVIEEIFNCFDHTYLNDMEIYFVNYYNSHKNGYNSTPGGSSDYWRNRKRIKTPEQIEKNKKFWIEKWSDENYRKETTKKISDKVKEWYKSKDENELKIMFKKSAESRKGYKQTEETKQKISVKAKLRDSNIKGSIWINKDNLNKRIDSNDLEIWKNQGWIEGRYIVRVITDEFRNKMKISARNRPKISDETRKRMSESAKDRKK